MTPQLTEAQLPRVFNIVCHLDPRYGGMSSSVPALAQATADSGRYKVNLATLCRPDEIVNFVPTGEVTLERLRLRRLRGGADYSLFCHLRSTFDNIQFAHIHGIWQCHSLVTGVCAKAWKIPFVVSAHGMLDPWAVRNKRFKKAAYSMLVERRILGQAGCLRALTHAEAVDYRRFGLGNPIAIIPNGISSPANVDPALFLNRFPQLKARRRVLFLSRIHHKKGLDFLCRAWSKICTKFSDSTLVLAGPDFENTRTSVEALVAELGIGSSVLFTGMLVGEMKWSALAGAEIFILPSFSEGFSVAVLEAMAMGKPTIVSHQCNFPEVSDFGCGLEIRPEIDVIADSITELLRAPAARLAAMGGNGAKLVGAKYSWKVVGNQMADLYDWLGGGQKPSSTEIITKKMS